MPTTIDDFEDGDLSEYQHDTTFDGRASLVSNPTHSGSNALSVSNENAELISTSGLENYPEAGDTFSFWVRATGGGDNLNVTWGVQDHQNRYYAKLYPASGDFYLFTYKSGSGSSQDSATGLSISQDSWYEIEIDWATDGTQTVTLYDNGGTQLAQISMSDSMWTSGGIGYDAYLASSGGTVYFDDIINKSADSGGGDDGGTTDTNIIDDFEDGSLDEYQHDTSRSGRASIVSSPTLSGSHALAISNENAELISTSGLDTYPSQGEIFNYWVRATGGADQINLTYGVQDHTNRYFVRVDFDDDWLMAFKYENSEYTQIAEATSGFVIPENQWLRVEVYWQTDGTHEITLFDSGGSVLSRISGTDSTWTSGGIGYDAYLASSGGSVYFDSVYQYRPDYTPNDGPTIIDDFEDGNLSEWSKHEETDNAEIVSSPTKDGSNYSVKLTGNVTLRSTSGLSNYPTAGDTISYWVQLESNSGIEDNPDGGIVFKYGGRYDNGSYGYAVYLFYGSSNLELYKWEGSNTKLAEDGTSPEIKFDEWYRIEINWGMMGHHWVSLYDSAGTLLTRIHGKDNTFKAGEIAIWPNTNTSGVGGTYYIDSIIMPKSDGADGDFST